MEIDKFYTSYVFKLEMTEDEFQTVMNYLGNSTSNECADAGVNSDTVARIFNQMERAYAK